MASGVLYCVGLWVIGCKQEGIFAPLCKILSLDFWNLKSLFLHVMWICICEKFNSMTLYTWTEIILVQRSAIRLRKRAESQGKSLSRKSESYFTPKSKEKKYEAAFPLFHCKILLFVFNNNNYLKIRIFCSEIWPEKV